ncbi:MAG TPA: NAD(P)/FAD-dependent oxidoreductase [Gammaproteobacteria bacterium]|nr:NAD(P)/FAD-dependent oxidoreductase [Gammaproteobacteria bacterium]
MVHYDVLIIGAGAAGLMCAIEVGKRKRKVLVLEKANKPGKKILMSGGGRCNFTNYHVHPNKYISKNPHFCKSALNRYTQWDFIELVQKHQIAYHEKKHGELFCDDKSKDIVNLLLKEIQQAHVELELQTNIEHIQKLDNDKFLVVTAKYKVTTDSLVIATGGLSIPSLGSSPFGYKIAMQFGIDIVPVRAGLVPLTWKQEDKTKFECLSGIAIDAQVRCEKTQFHENILFTHRGLSGPAILQISNFWQEHDELVMNLLPGKDLNALLHQQKAKAPLQTIKHNLSNLLPARLVQTFLKQEDLMLTLSNASKKKLESIAHTFQTFRIKPNGTEGYRTAEVTLGGVDCDAISSKTMECTKVKGLYFIGEVLDVTGWLGGYNFQWAWSSGWAAGQVA